MTDIKIINSDGGEFVISDFMTDNFFIITESGQIRIYQDAFDAAVDNPQIKNEIYDCFIKPCISEK